MVDLEIDLKEARNYIAQRLGNVKDGNVEKVLKRSLGRAAKAYRTATIRETQKKYFLKGDSIDSNVKFLTEGDGFIVKTTSLSRLITHYDYGTVNTKTGRQKKKFKDGERKFYGTKVFKKNKLKYLSNTFWIPNKKEKEGSYKGILLQRPRGLTGEKAQKPNNWLVLGPAIGTIVRNDEIVEKSTKRADEILYKRIDHEIERILQNGG